MHTLSSRIFSEQDPFDLILWNTCLTRVGLTLFKPGIGCEAILKWLRGNRGHFFFLNLTSPQKSS
ncbi:MAG: hypothetical protein EBV63_06045 [Actinobacteria bacterium]|nr:hypothetical protein [Actinomycetota bacterium]